MVVVQDVRTRWCYTLRMLIRISDLKSPINIVLAERSKEKYILTTRYWEIIHAYIKVVEPISDASKIMEEENCSILSYYIRMVIALLNMGSDTEGMNNDEK